MPVKLNTEEFIKRAIAVHGNVFNYKKVDYIKSTLKVKLICKVHGVFEQVADVHLRGFGCAKCSGNHPYTAQEFTQIAKNIFPDYDYALCQYINVSTPVAIICKEHGVFYKHPSPHIKKKEGCPKCNGYDKFKIDTAEFIDRAIKKHGHLYDYSEVKYINDYTKVNIVCNKHGVFSQSPNAHLQGKGCIICSGRYNYTTADFIMKAKELHQDKYDYRYVNYTKAHNKVEIVCKKHGIFKQLACSHLVGQGCSRCLNSKGEEAVCKFLKDNNIVFIQQHKFSKCVSKYKLRFDFFIPSLNTCIEYDGEFHFLPIFGVDKMKEQQKRDLKKDEYCSENNIRFIRIKYDQYLNISSILNHALSTK